MFVINDDQSIYATRGDIVFFTVSADDGGESYAFQPGDIVRMKVYGKKDAETVYMQKDFPVTAATQEVEIYLTEADTKIGETNSRPKDYWYEIELNPDTNPQTIIGYDEDGAKVFKLFPEGEDVEEDAPEIDPEDIPLVDDALDMTSLRPVQNQAIARAITKLEAAVKDNKTANSDLADQMQDSDADIKREVAVERARIDNLVAGGTADDAEVIDIRVGADGVTHESAGAAVRSVGEKVVAMTALEVEWIDGQYIINNQHTGFVANSTSYECTDYIEMPPLGFSLRYIVTISSGPIIARFDKHKRLIDYVAVDAKTTLSGELTNADGCRYVRLSNMKSNDAFIWVSAMAGAKPTSESVTEEMIAEDAITADKAGFLSHAPWTNHLKEDFWIENCYVNGSAEKQGIYTTSSGLWATKRIPLEAGVSYEFEGLYHGYYAFFDADFNFVSGNDAGDLVSPFVVPDGAAYGAFTATSEDEAKNAWIGSAEEYAYIADDNVYAKTIPTKYNNVKPCDYDGNDIGVFAHGLCVGDSLTQGGFNCTVDGCEVSHSLEYPQYSYPKKLEMISGIPMTNAGISGYTAAQWYAKYKNTDLSGHDFAIIHLGVNDAYQNGGWTTESVTAFENIIGKLEAENKNIKIFVATIAPMKSYQNAAIKEVSQGIRDMISGTTDENVILLDMAAHGHTNDSLAYNCGHLSAYGYWRLAKDFNNYISWYISQNQMQFRTVQFTGSDCEYTV